MLIKHYFAYLICSRAHYFNNQVYSSTGLGNVLNIDINQIPIRVTAAAIGVATLLREELLRLTIYSCLSNACLSNSYLS